MNANELTIIEENKAPTLARDIRKEDIDSLEREFNPDNKIFNKNASPSSSYNSYKDSNNASMIETLSKTVDEINKKVFDGDIYEPDRFQKIDDSPPVVEPPVVEPPVINEPPYNENPRDTAGGAG